MKLIEWFNYKDWWAWVYYFILIYAVIDMIKAIDTLQRWKWGYWSIDFIPGLILLFMLFVFDVYIKLDRLSKRVSDLEEKCQ